MLTRSFTIRSFARISARRRRGFETRSSNARSRLWRRVTREEERERDREREKERNGKRIVTIRREKFSYIIRNEIERIVPFRKFERYSSFGEIRYEHEDIGKLEGSSVRLEKEPVRGKNTAFFSFLDGKMIRGDPIEIKFKKVYCNKPLSPRGNGLYDT